MNQGAFLTDLELPAQPLYLGRPRSASDPVFSTSLVHGKHYINRNTAKREYGGPNLKTLAKQKDQGQKNFHFVSRLILAIISWTSTRNVLQYIEYEPAFQAMAVMSPDTRLNDVDVVINRTTILNLIKFLKGTSFQEFHLHLDFEKNTLFIGRQVRNAKVRSTRNSYGRNFEAALTESEIDGATTHHRMLKYKLGSLTLVVRHEADAYDPAIVTPPDPDALPTVHPSFDLGYYDAKTFECDKSQGTIVIPQGKVVPQHQILELKSNASSRPLDQMWLGRTPTCCLGGKHNAAFDGTYKRRDIRIKSVTQKGDHKDNYKGFESWEADNQEVLQKLVTLLQLLRKTVDEKTEQRSAVLVAMSGDDLKLYQTKKRIGALPKEIVDRFLGLRMCLFG
ncbi:unnamed protein product [Alternaria alternata]